MMQLQSALSRLMFGETATAPCPNETLLKQLAAKRCLQTKKLDFSHCTLLADDHLRMLSVNAPNLEELNLSYTKITEIRAFSLGGTLRFDCLTKLTVDGCTDLKDVKLNAQNLTEFSAKGCPNLEGLSVWSKCSAQSEVDPTCQVSPTILRLVNTSRYLGITAYDLRNISDAELAGMLTSLEASTTLVSQFRPCGEPRKINPMIHLQLQAIGATSHLTSVVFRDCMLRDSEVEHLCDHLKGHTKLEAIDLSNNCISDYGALAVIQLKNHLPSLKKVNLQGNPMYQSV